MIKKDKIWIAIIISCAVATGILFKINRDNMMALKNPPQIDYKSEFLKREELRKSRSLLIVDLFNFKELKVKDNVFFNYKNNGFLENSKWIDDKYAILAKDINNDGIINNGLELFGYYEKGFGGYLYSRGFNVLGQEDTNKDGVINSYDKDFNLLKIWIDENKNGNVDYNELFPLSKYGVYEISLKTDKVEISETNPLGYLKKASKVKVENYKKPLNIYEVSLPVDLETTAYYPISQTEFLNPYNLEINLNIFGNVYALKDEIHMRKDENLKNEVENYLKEYDILKREEILDKIMLIWTKSDVISPDSRGDFIDARKLNAYEVISGKKFISYNDGDVEFSNPNKDEALKLISKYNDLKRKLRYSLSNLSFSKEMLETVDYNYNEEKRVYDIDISQMLSYIKMVFDIDNFKGELLISELSDVLKKSESRISFNKLPFNKEVLDKIKSYGKADGDKFQQLLFKIDNDTFYPFDLIVNEKPLNFETKQKAISSVPVSEKVEKIINENSEKLKEIKQEEKVITNKVEVNKLLNQNKNANEKSLEIMEKVKQEDKKDSKN